MIHPWLRSPILCPSALHGQYGQDHFAYTHTPDRAVALLAKWFGGRCNLKEHTIAGITDPETKSARHKLQKVIALRAVQGHLIMNTSVKDVLESGFAEEFKKTAILCSSTPLAAFSVLCLFFND